MTEDDHANFYDRARIQAFQHKSTTEHKSRPPDSSNVESDIKIHHGAVVFTGPDSYHVFQDIAEDYHDESSSDLYEDPEHLPPKEGTIFGNHQSTSGPSNQFTFAIPARLRKDDMGAVPNNFCHHCKNLTRKARAIQMKPKDKEEKYRATIHIEENHASKFSDLLPHHTTFSDLYQSGREGCHLCALLAAPSPGLKHSELPPPDSELPFMLGVVEKQSYDGPGYIQIGVLGYQKKVIELSYDAPNFQLQGTLQSKRTDTDEAFALANRWLNKCCNDHKICNKIQDEQMDLNPLPTRLLEIESENNELKSIRLRDTSEESFDSSCSFLALSHCWGGSIATSLRNSTLASFGKNLPLDSLPKNFIDAATITIRLGYAYLWIDSLFIIQDSTDDCEENFQQWRPCMAEQIVPLPHSEQKIVLWIVFSIVNPSR